MICELRVRPAGNMTIPFEQVVESLRQFSFEAPTRRRRVTLFSRSRRVHPWNLPAPSVPSFPPRSTFRS